MQENSTVSVNNNNRHRALRWLLFALAVVVTTYIVGIETGGDILFKAANFIIILSVIVFVHEFGHYIIAKWAGVKIETFSIGFGRELTGWNDKSGTRWKISALPLGGYVKMYGDASEASTPSEELINMSEEEKAKTFHHKPLHKKAAIVAAGPLANFLLTIIILTGFIYTRGISSTEPIIGAVMPQSAAESAGLQPGDRVIKVNGSTVEIFNDIPNAMLTNLGTPLTLQIERNGKVQDVTLTPKMVTDKDPFGSDFTHPVIGIVSTKLTSKTVGPIRAVWEATRLTYTFCITTLKGVGQIITGERSATKDIKGPIGMAKMSGAAVEKGFHTTLYFIAILSANLGLVNLFPIPILDGGHLLFYLIQAVTRRPINPKLQEYSFRVGMALISMLMAFAVINDFWQLK